MKTLCSSSTRAAVAALLLTAAIASAQKPAKAEAKPKLPTIAYETYTLPNGLKVITHEDHRLPLVSVDLWYHVGPLNEKAGRTGFAHLFEHMMFEGSEHVGEKAHFKYVEGVGGTDINGTTSFDRTNYFETLPANQLELGLWLESDRMGFLMEGLDRKLLQNQRDVVRNERRQGEGQPYAAAREEVFHQLYPKSHPYYGNVIGSHADVEAARIADVRDFHQQYYTPNNASIAIAGDFNAKQLKDLLIKYFGPIPAGPPVERVNAVTPPITSQRRATVTDTVTLPQLTIAWLTPPGYTPAAYDMDAAAFALGGAKVSRLSNILIYKTQVAQTVNCSNYTLKLNGMMQCSVIAKPGVKLEDLEATVWSEIAKLQQEGPTAAELEASKNTTISEKVVGLQRLGGFGGIADTLDEYNQYTGDPGYLPKDIAAIQGVTIAGTKAAAIKYLTKESAVVVYCVPGEKVLNDVPRSPDDTDADVKITNPYTAEFEAAQNFRKTAPAGGPPVTVHLPVPETFTLSNGLKVYVVENRALPVLSAAMITRAGSENNTPEKAGLATFTTRVMNEATTTRNLKEFADAQELIGTNISMNANMDSANTSMTILTSHTQEGMNLFSDVLQHPTFKAEAVDRLRKRRLVAIKQETDSVGAMAARVGPTLLYAEQPYGLSQTGTTASVTSFTPADVAGFYATHYGPTDSALVLAGDISVAEAKPLAEKYFGGWKGAAAAPVTVPAPPAIAATHVVIVDKPGAPQTSLTVYGLGVPVGSPDDPALDVLTYTLGGAFASRINMNLREVHGYTYGAFAYYNQFREGGPFIASSLVRTDVTGPAAKELLGEIRRFPVEPSTEPELRMAKDSSIQSLPGQFETTSSIAGSMGSIFLYDRPLDYYATLPAKYRAVSATDVARVAKEDLHPGNLIIVAAGDRAKIEKQLKDADLGPVEVRDINGKLIGDNNK